MIYSCVINNHLQTVIHTSRVSYSVSSITLITSPKLPLALIRSATPYVLSWQSHSYKYGHLSIDISTGNLLDYCTCGFYNITTHGVYVIPQKHLSWINQPYGLFLMYHYVKLWYSCFLSKLFVIVHKILKSTSNHWQW